MIAPFEVELNFRDPSPIDTAYEAHAALAEIRRDFAEVCRAVTDAGTTIDPEIFREWVTRERQAAARFEVAIAMLAQQHPELDLT